MPRLETRIKHLDFSCALTVKMFPPPEDKSATVKGEYRYEFKGPPRQMNDEVIKMVIKVIQFLNKRHMIFAAANVWPHALDTHPPLWPCGAKGAKGARKLYEFTQDSEEFPLAAEIMIPRGTKELKVDKILVRNKHPDEHQSKQIWTPLIEWLLHLPDAGLLTSGRNRYGVPRILQCQQTWWSKTGKFFALLQLPAELRALVFKHALGTNIYPHTRYNQTLVAEEVTLGSAPNYNVLCLSKKTREEALKAGWEGTWKHFVTPSPLAKVLDISVVTPKYMWLRRIQLAFTFSKYFEFFGVSISPNVHFATSSPDTSVIGNINGFSHLELYFKSPYEYEGRDNPWKDFRNHNSAWLQDERFKDMPAFPCQKSIIDWLMTFAFPYLKAVPNVHLEGAVKRCTKQNWQLIFDREYRERKHTNGGNYYDHAGNVAVLLNLPPYA